jgi:predicted dinucleotide-binding enzyme
MNNVAFLGTGQLGSAMVERIAAIAAPVVRAS